MRVKLVVVDLEVSPRVKAWAKWLGLPLAILLGTTAIVRAADPNIWHANDVLTANDLNASFKAVTDRLVALEAAKTSVKIVMDDSAGPLPAAGKTAMFASGGGQLMIVISGSGFAASPTQLDVEVQLDGTPIGHLTVTTNEANSHKSFPARMLTAAPASGTHTIALVPSPATITDGADFFNVTVVETR
jgi:hypothetical protein